MKISIEDLSETALVSIIEGFVLREGTEYGAHEFDLAAKCDEVRKQLINGEAQIHFDAVNDSLDIRPTLDS